MIRAATMPRGPFAKPWQLALLFCCGAILLGPIAGRAFALDPAALAAIAALLALPLLLLAGLRGLDLLFLCVNFAAIAFLTAIRHRSTLVAEEPNPFYDWTLLRATAPELLCCAAFVAHWLRREIEPARPRPHAGPVPWLLGAFLGLGLLVGLLHGNELEACMRDGRKVAYVALAHLLVVAIADTPERGRLLVRVLALALAAAALVKIADYGANEGFHYNGFLRTSVDVADFLGFLALVYVPAALLKSAPCSRARRALLVLLILVGSAATISTFSRAAWCAAPVGLAVLLLHPVAQSRRAPRIALAFTLLAAVVAPLLIGGIAERASERVESLLDPESDPSVSYRVRELHGAVAVALDHPVVGIGMGTPFDAGAAIVDRRRVAPTLVHDLFVWSALKAGLPGLLLVLAILIRGALTLSRAARRATDPREAALALGLLALLAAFAVIGLVGAMLNQARTAFLLGAVTGLAQALFLCCGRRPAPATEPTA